MNAFGTRAPVRIGIDYRPVTVAPWSGIGRQVQAMEQALLGMPGVIVVRFTAGPFEHPHRVLAVCPPWESPLEGFHHPRERLKFEGGFLPSAIREQGLDLYIATVNAGLPLRRPQCRTRYVLLLHDVFQLTMQSRRGSRLRGWVWHNIDRFSIRHSIRMADAIWTPSEFTARSVGQLFPERRSRVAVLPNGVPVPEVLQDAERPAGMPERYWLAVGTREPRKNIPWFVEQWRLARSSNRAVPPLVLVGHAADLPESQRGLAELIFATEVDDATLEALYQNAERLWQPSIAEGFGLPVVEALARGTPVAVANGSALDEVAPPHAPRFDPEDGYALRSLMIRLAMDPARRMHENRSWAQRFSMPAYTARVLQSVDRLIAMKVAA